MSNSAPLPPHEILNVSLDVSETRAKFGFLRLLILGILAGAFIAFAAEASNMASFNLLAKPETYGLGRALSGAIFSTGLMLIILAGGELFTGNTLMIGAVIKRRISVVSLLRNWIIVYIANLIGSLLIVWFMSQSGLMHLGGEMLGVVTLRIAVMKVNLSFFSAVVLGIMCNWLVCLAIWITFGADSTVGKIFGIFFPIWLFVTSGFEHSIANMYFIPAGILAKGDPAIIDAALQNGMTQDALDSLTWGSFFVDNLIPVTIGNMIGGCVFVSLAYILAYREKKTDEK